MGRSFIAVARDREWLVGADARGIKLADEAAPRHAGGRGAQSPGRELDAPSLDPSPQHPKAFGHPQERSDRDLPPCLQKYLPLYLADFQFRHNNRKNPDLWGNDGRMLKRTDRRAPWIKSRDAASPFNCAPTRFIARSVHIRSKNTCLNHCRPISSLKCRQPSAECSAKYPLL